MKWKLIAGLYLPSLYLYHNILKGYNDNFEVEMNSFWVADLFLAFLGLVKSLRIVKVIVFYFTFSDDLTSVQMVLKVKCPTYFFERSRSFVTICSV